MASPSIIDIDQLCSPISDGQPVGPYWRDDDECLEIFPSVQSAHKDARYDRRKKSEAALFPEDSIERSNYEDPDWGKVIDAGTKLLAKSKDLWVAAWLIEALAHEHGFAGLRDGFKLTHQLCETYWDSVHPRPDDLDGIHNTLAKLDGDILTLLIPSMPITSSGMTTADYDKSAEMDGLDSEAKKDSYRSLGVVSTAAFEAHVRDSGPEFLRNLLDDAQAAYDEFVALDDFFDERCGQDAPASSKVKEGFEQTLDLIRELSKPYLPVDEERAEPETKSNAGDGGLESGGAPSGWNREYAFREISRLAELFKKHEPNSPVAWMLDRAVQLGNLAWPDLIDVLAGDAATEIRKLSGLPDKTTRDGDDQK